jgi:hypothetical protein
LLSEGAMNIWGEAMRHRIADNRVAIGHGLASQSRGGRNFS